MQMPASRTLGQLLEEMANRHADRPAIVFEGKTYSFSEFNQQVNRLAKGLLALGVSRGETVALLATNRPEWLWVCFAATRIGAVVCPMNTWYKPSELDYALKHCEARVLLTMDRFLQRNFVEELYGLIPELSIRSGTSLRSQRYPFLRSVVVLGDTRYPGTLSLNDLEAGGEEISNSQLERAASRVESKDLCYILYTSGSTAAPKAVMLQHYGAIENCFQIGERQHLTHEDRLWLVVPLFYGLASVNGMPAIYTHGGCIVLQEYFEPGRALEIIERERCTVYYGFGNITRRLINHPDFSRTDLSSLRKGVVGFTPEDKRLTIEVLGVSKCCSIYGLTESYGNCAVTDAEDPLEAKLHTQGKPLPGWEFKIIEPQTGQRLPQGQVGLLCIRGYTTLGYFKNPAETANAFDADGFFITGDLGVIDGDGRLRFHSRLKEMIKTGGINVSPQEVEQVLELHPKIRQVYVVGIPDEARGEAIVALVEREGNELKEEDVRQFVRQQAASFKAPHHVFFLTDTEIPRLATGKVAKIQLREWAMRQLAGSGTE